MKKAYIVICLVMLLTVASLAVRSFLLDDSVLAGKPVAPPAFAINVNSTQINQSNPGDPYDIYINLDSTWNGILMNMPQYAGESWATLHLPSGDVFLTGYGEQLFVYLPASQMPAFGTPIKADITAFWGGKTTSLTYTITNWE